MGQRAVGGGRLPGGGRRPLHRHGQVHPGHHHRHLHDEQRGLTPRGTASRSSSLLQLLTTKTFDSDDGFKLRFSL